METPPMILPISPISMWCQGPSHYLRCPHVSGNLHGSLAPDYPVSGKFGQFDRKRPRQFLDLAGEKAAFLVYSLGNKWGKLQKMADGPNHLQRWLGTPEKILQLETQLYTITTLKWWCITCSFLPFGSFLGVTNLRYFGDGGCTWPGQRWGIPVDFPIFLSSFWNLPGLEGFRLSQKVFRSDVIVMGKHQGFWS